MPLVCMKPQRVAACSPFCGRLPHICTGTALRARPVPDASFGAPSRWDPSPAAMISPAGGWDASAPFAPGPRGLPVFGGGDARPPLPVAAGGLFADDDWAPAPSDGSMAFGYTAPG